MQTHMLTKCVMDYIHTHSNPRQLPLRQKRIGGKRKKKKKVAQDLINLPLKSLWALSNFPLTHIHTCFPHLPCHPLTFKSPLITSFFTTCHKPSVTQLPSCTFFSPQLAMIGKKLNFLLAHGILPILQWCCCNKNSLYCMWPLESLLLQHWLWGLGTGNGTKPCCLRANIKLITDTEP